MIKNWHIPFIKKLLTARKFIIYPFLIINFILLIYIHKTDHGLNYNWLVFYFWLLNYSIAILFVIFKIPFSVKSKLLYIIKKDFKILMLILFISLFTRFFLITDYPYVKLGDEVRDTGLNALRIYQGSIKDLFAFGPYESHTNFIPLISYFFSIFLKNSTLIYLVPTALIGVLTIILIYIVTRVWQGRTTAIIASLFLTASIFHLHYSRTELVIVTDSLLSIMVIAAVYSSFYSKVGFLLIGLIYGLALHFYAGIRGILFISFFYLCLLAVINLYSQFRTSRAHLFLSIKKIILCGMFLLIGIFVGLGPMVNNMTKDNLFSRIGVTRPITDSDVFSNKNLFEKISFIYGQYKEALSVYNLTSTTDQRSALRYHAPLLSFPMDWLFLFGLFFLIVNATRDKFSGLMAINIFLFPFTNQVMVNEIGRDHRLLAIIPILCIVAAFGLYKLIEIIKLRYAQYAIMFVALVAITYHLFFYYYERPSEKGYDTKDYIMQNILDYIKRDTSFNRYYLLNDDYYNYNFLHYLEKIEFITFPKNVQLLNKHDFLEKLTEEYSKEKEANFIFINPIPELSRYNKKLFTVNCVKKSLLPQYNCPVDFTGSYSFYSLD